jgi:hypothetical protein
LLVSGFGSLGSSYAGYKDKESGKTATMPNTAIRQIESIHENNISLIDSIDNPVTDYPVCPICSRSCDNKPTSVACESME